jgi:hypothetical protein
MNAASLKLLVILGAIFLSGCAGTEENACGEPQSTVSKLISEGQKFSEMFKAESYPQYYSSSQEAYYKAALTTVNYGECFSPEEIAESQIFISSIQK